MIGACELYNLEGSATITSIKKEPSNRLITLLVTSVTETGCHETSRRPIYTIYPKRNPWRIT
jgi:hypothetical protein